MRAWALCGCALFWACSTARIPRVGDAPPESRDEAGEHQYQEILSRFSDQKGIYDGLDTRLFVAATWQSPRFIEARVRRAAEFQVQPEAEATRRVLAEREKFKGATEFFLGVHANDPRFDDFDKKGSIWRLALLVGEKEYLPVSVKRVGRATMDMRSTYPYMDTFWVAYAVRFGTVMNPGLTATLKVASSLGQTELNFQTE